MQYRTLLVDPPWPEKMVGKWKVRNARPDALSYPTMTLQELAALPIAEVADSSSSQIYLWTTNRFLEAGFGLIRSWGFKFLNTVTWVKPSGFGPYWINRTQTLLMGYRGKCQFRQRFKPNVINASARRHSQKPEAGYELIESVGFGPRLELFGRREREGWTVIGNGIDGKDIRSALAELL